MATTNALKYKDSGAFVEGQLTYRKLVYDFGAGDDGLTDAIVKLGKFSDKVIMKQAVVRVGTAFTSAGAPTVDVGFTGGDVDYFCAAQLKGALTADAVIAETTNIPTVIAANTEIQLNVKVADLTAGSLELHIWYVKA